MREALPDVKGCPDRKEYEAAGLLAGGKNAKKEPSPILVFPRNGKIRKGDGSFFALFLGGGVLLGNWGGVW